MEGIDVVTVAGWAFLGLTVLLGVAVYQELAAMRRHIRRERAMLDARGAYLDSFLADIITDRIDDAAERGDITWPEARRFYFKLAELTGVNDFLPSSTKLKIFKDQRTLLKEAIKRRVAYLRISRDIVFPDDPRWVIFYQHIKQEN